ncbi:MAG: TetR family transcriptional regulator C-terminal domain-containing protein [Lachnospiraceae bacterium]|nr:TetR family transcriptional regulator C-terminal domain-containing protein [Lachnospiraceae bacterium]
MKDNQRVILTKRLLKDGLLRLLKTKELDKINISELCRESGINRATFYRHYESAHDVLVDLEMDLIRDIDVLSSGLKTLSDAKQYLEMLCTYLYERSDLIKTLIRCNTDADFAQLMNEFYQRLLTLKGDLPEFRDLDPDSLKLISTYLAGGGYFLMRSWLVEDIPKTPKEITELVFRFTNER